GENAFTWLAGVALLEPECRINLQPTGPVCPIVDRSNEPKNVISRHERAARRYRLDNFHYVPFGDGFGSVVTDNRQYVGVQQSLSLVGRLATRARSGISKLVLRDVAFRQCRERLGGLAGVALHQRIPSSFDCDGEGQSFVLGLCKRFARVGAQRQFAALPA